MLKQRRGVVNRVWVLPLLLVTAPAPADPQTKPQIRGVLSEIDGAKVLHVWGTADERGFAQGHLLAADIIALLDGYLTDGEVSGGAAAYQAHAIPMTKMMRLAPGYEAELRGMLAGIKDRLGGSPQVPSLGRALEYSDLVALNCIPDIALFGCSSFAAWGPMTENGATLVGRNLDWRRVDALDGSQMIVVRAPQPDTGRLGWVSVTWPGFIGCLTGMNADGVTVCMHDVSAGSPSAAAGFTPRALALRDAVESAHAATAIEDITRVLRGLTCAVGNNVPVTMPYASTTAPSAVFEYDGALTDKKGVTVRMPGEVSFQLCTNHYVERAVPRDCTRYATIDARLTKSAGRRETLGRADAWRILESVARPTRHVPSLLTYQGVVFEPNKRLLHVAFSRDGRAATDGRPVTLDLAALLDARRFRRAGD